VTAARPSVAVLGGGIAGLATAHFLAARGYRPVIFESSDAVGGLGGSFEHEGVRIDRFYHVLLDTDAELLSLIDDVGLTDRLVWQPTGMGFHVGGRLYGLNTPLDLLRFSALSAGDRLRTAWGALRATRLQRRPQRLDEVTAHEWLRPLFGAAVTDGIWLPLLRAKFGEAGASIPAYWLWSLLSREKNGGRERKGYLRGGYQALAEALCAAIRGNGGEVRLRQPVDGIERAGGGIMLRCGERQLRFDIAVSTVPLAVLRKLARGALRADLPLEDLRYQGVVNALVVARRPLERFYWTVVVDPRFGFQGVVETTHVIPPQWLGGRHLIYLMNYCDSGSELYNRSDDEVGAQARRGLALLYPRLTEDSIEAIYVFRAPHVEPVWSLGYLKRKPPFRVGSSRFYLCTTAQAYPRVTAWNTSIGLASDLVREIVKERNVIPPDSRGAQAVPARPTCARPAPPQRQRALC
jgi:protoporphyrinogen oxidase